MDRITNTLVAEFAAEQQLAAEDLSVQFEHFVNVAVVSSEYDDTFAPDDVHVGKDANPGIDGLAIIVNGSLVTDIDEVDDLVTMNKYLDVTFIFTQSKTSSSFDGGDIGSFIEAVRDFFREDPRLVRTDTLKTRADISDKIFSLTAKMRTNPTCLLYYVTTGLWTNDTNLLARLDQGRQDLEATSLFSSVRLTACGAKEIQELYRSSKDVATAEIDFPNKVTLPDIDNVEQAFVGVVPVATLFKLIVDDGGNIRRSVFEDNIRDFQGDTGVNSSIAATLSSPVANRFAVLNNGITIVCRKLSQTGNKCTLHGYQIVNGCQTSNVLFASRGNFDPERVLVTLKLVGSEHEDLVSDIIRATNSQNAVKPEDLEAITEFQKRLEQFYGTYKGPQALYYERRSRQWASTHAEKTRVVTIRTQIKAFASMFLNSPHRVAGYYGTVRGRMGNQIFSPDHKCDAYFLSAYALYRLDCLFRSRSLSSSLKPIRWFLLLLFRHTVAGAPPAFNSAKIEKYCTPLLDLLCDNDRSAAVFAKLAARAQPFISANSDATKTQAYRDSLLAAVVEKEFAGA